MALINCPECGASVSDRAPSCPQCGCPLNQPEQAIFYLTRENKAFLCAAKYEVYLDYQLRGVIKNGETISTLVSCRTHHLQLIDRTNFNKTVYEGDIDVGREGLALSFSAAMNVSMVQTDIPISAGTQGISRSIQQPAPSPSVGQNVYLPTYDNQKDGMRCPRCGGKMTVQTVAESRKAGCGTIILYILLALTIFGLLIVIPLALRKKTETVTYAVCQNCGYQKTLSRR